MSAAPSPEQQAALIFALANAQYWVLHIAVGALAFLLYDNLLTFDREVALIWQSKWNAGTAVFFINRYATLGFLITTIVGYTVTPDQATENFCRGFWAFQGAANIISIGIVELVLMARSYAVWNCSKPYLCFMLGLWLAQVSGMTLTFALLLPSFVYLPSHTVPWLIGCHAIGAKPIGIYIWVCIVSFEGILFVCTVGKLLWNNYSSGKTKLVSILTRDTIVYFLVLLAIVIINAIFEFQAGRVFAQVILGLSSATPSVACSRLLLNLREASTTDTSLWSVNTLPLVFASPGSGTYRSGTQSSDEPSEGTAGVRVNTMSTRTKVASLPNTGDRELEYIDEMEMAGIHFARKDEE